jgi:PAS domain S-box-containing protein
VSSDSITLKPAEYDALQSELNRLRAQVKQQQTQNLSQQQLLSHTIQHLRASLNIEEILLTTVTEVRQLLKADRVAIFEFDPESGYDDGTFVIESVDPRFSSVVSHRVHDHCFGTQWAARYVQGRCQVVADIEAAGLSPCHREILAQFQVRANLVMPLLQGRQLWGLLCVHQCRESRHWYEGEVEFVRQIGDHLSVALQQADLFAQVQHQTTELEELRDRLKIKITQQQTSLQSLQQKHVSVRGQLQARENQLYQFVEHTPAAVAMFDTEMRYLLASRRWLEDYGLGDQTVIGRSHYEIFPTLGDEWKVIHQRCLTGVVERCEEDFFYREDGSQEWLTWEVRPWYDEGGHVGGIIMFTEVITPRKRIEAQLRDANERLEVVLDEKNARLRSTESRLQNIAENLPGMLYQYAVQPDYPHGHFLYASPRSHDIFGCPPEEMASGLVATHPEDQQRLATLIHQSMLTLEKFRYEGRIQNQTSGEMRWIEAISQPERYEDGSIVWDGVMFDISDRKKIEQELRLYKQVLASSSDAVGITTPAGEHIYQNRAFNDLYGYASAAEFQAAGGVAAAFVDAAVAADVLRSLTSGQPWSGEVLQRTKDGTMLNILLRADVIRDEDGTILGFVGVNTNITEIKAAERALQQTTNTLKEAQHLAHIGNWRYDIDADQITGSEELWRIFHHPSTPEQLNLDTWLSFYHPEDRPLLRTALDHTQATGETQSLELRILKRADAVGHAQVRMARSLPTPQAPSRLYGTVLDITQRKKAELLAQQKAAESETALHNLQRTQSHLIQSEKMSSLGQLVAGVAHEINNPVNFIYGNITHATEYASSLLEIIAAFQAHYRDMPPDLADLIDELDLDFLSEDLPKLLKSMQVGAQRIREIVASLRTFSRLDEAEVKAVDLHEGIDSTLMILQSRFKAHSDRPAVILNKNYGHLPKVECYPGQLNQVLMNIIVNSLDAMEERDAQRDRAACAANPSSLSISTGVDLTGSSVVIRIRDNGPGIPDEIQSRIFDPFFTTKAIGKGTGMGMSISYQIITERHGGSLTFVSSDHGTEFTISIPAYQAITA